MARAVTFVLSLLTVLTLATSARAQSISVQSGGVDVASETTVAAVEQQLITLNDALTGPGAAIDAVHGEAVIASGPQFIGEAKDIDGGALPNAVTEGQAIRAAFTLSGATMTTLVNEAGTADIGATINSALDTLDSIVGVEDAAETAGGGLARMGAVVRLAAAGSTVTDNENATVNVDGLGLLWARFLDPCSGVAKTTIPINISSATTTEITAALAGASNHYYVCSVNLVTAAANNVAIADDDSDNCGTPANGMAGGTTAGSGWNFAANGGISLGNGGATVLKTNGTNRVVCIVTSAATQLSGTMVVVAAP